jgi:hypothetical protein
MLKIALIGVGNIGIRYLEGILKSDLILKVELLDKKIESINYFSNLIKQFKNSSHNIDLVLRHSIEDFSSSLDLAIISTTADVRFQVACSLIEQKRIKNIILEKIVFQKPEEYLIFNDLIIRKNINCYVNHPRRVYPFYQKLKQKIIAKSGLIVTIQGGDWGLGCNALHYIDLISYLVESDEIRLSVDFLDKEIINSKRPGFIEFSGVLCGTVGDARFFIYSGKTESPTIITINNSEFSYTIQESAGLIYEVDLKKITFNILEEKIQYYQSEITSDIINQILVTGNSSLPRFQEVIRIHTIFIKNLLEFYNKITNEFSSTLNIS